MAYKRGTIQFLGDQGSGTPSYAKTVVMNPTDAAALETLADYIETSLSDCVKNKTSIAESIDGSDVAPGTGVDVDVRAVILCRNTADGSITKHQIPGPTALAIIDTAEGRRVDPTLVAGFAAALSTATGNTYIGISGHIIEKK